MRLCGGIYATLLSSVVRMDVRETCGMGDGMV